MKTLKKQRIARTTGFLIMLSILLFSFMDCSKSEEELFASIRVYNQCGKALDIFMDGNFQFLLEYESNAVIENISLGIHLFEAYLAGTETLVRSVDVNVVTGGEYDWTIQGVASITITNEYGETLEILMDGSYLGAIEDTADETIGSVIFGEHSLEAKKLSDNTIVASTTIDVTEIKEYFWVITQ